MAQDNYVAPSIITSGATFADLQAGGLAKIIDMIIAANPAFANPASTATVAVTGGGSTGGLLPAGAYRVVYTYGDGAGESTIGTSRSNSFTVSAGNIPRVTFNDTPPTGAVWRNIYLTPAGGAAGTEKPYATGIAVGTTTFDLAFDHLAQATGIFPTTNTTGAANVAHRIRAYRVGGLQLLWSRLSDLTSEFVSGKPSNFWDTRNYIRHIAYAMAVHQQAAKEILTLIAANPGTLTHAATDIQDRYYRSFP